MSKEEAVAKVIALAEEQIGYVPYSGKRTKFADELDDTEDWYNGKKSGYDWCDVFVDWLFFKSFGKQNALKMLYQPTKSLGAACPYSANYYINNGAWRAVPEVGDQIFFGDRRDEDHTGIVWKVTANYVYTIEGNAGGGNGKVMKRQYALTNGWISGYGRPNWSVVASAEPKPEPKPEPEPKPTVPKIIEEDGIFGPLSVKALQKLIGFKETGVFESQEKSLTKYWPALTAVTYGENGSPAVKALQEYLTGRGFPCDPDGYLGPETIKAWRSWLKKQQGFSITIAGTLDDMAAWATQRTLNNYHRQGRI